MRGQKEGDSIGSCGIHGYGYNACAQTTTGAEAPATWGERWGCAHSAAMECGSATAPRGVTFAELSFTSDLVRNTLLAHPCLEAARREVRYWGGTVVPVWGNGAIILYPYHSDAVPLPTERGIFKSTHIIFADVDKMKIGTALLQIPEEDRPLLLLPTQTDILDALFDSD